MKSREEYLASIFAKRDALLAKRKKRISYLTASACIILCFAAAFIALPQRIEGKIESATTVQAAGHYQSAEAVQASESTSETTKIRQFGGISPLEPIDEDKLAAENLSQKQFGYWVTYHTDISDANVQEEIYAAEAEPEGAENAVPASTKKPSALGRYTNDEIISAAYEHLTEEEKKTVSTESAQVTVTRDSQGGETYQIWFFGESRIKITLSAEGLELIDKNSEKLSETTAKSAATTAAPAYNPMG